MSKSYKARKGSVSRDRPWKGPRESLRFEKVDWNRYVRREGKRFVREFAATFFVHRLVLDAGHLPRRERVRPAAAANMRPWLD